MTQRIVHADVHGESDLLPVRMCNELVYCPRLFHLEHVQGIFIHSADTVEGRGQHERAKRRGSKLRVLNAPAPSEDTRDADELFWALPRKLALTSDALGIRGEVDLVEIGDGSIVVVEAKHGSAPRSDDHSWHGHRLPFRAWPADVAQVALYMALLREIGMPCDQARILYRRSNDRIAVAWSRELELFAHAVVAKARAVAAEPIAPEPLVDSPKCAGCSLHEVCLPDEHHALRAEQAGQERPESLRRIVASRDERAIVHVLTPGSTVRKDGDALVVAGRTGEQERILLKDVQHLALFGPVHVTTPCMQHVLREGIGVSHHTGAGRLLGMTSPLSTRNVGLRRAQYRAADDPAQALRIARALVLAKIRNQRTVLRRHRRGLAVLADETLGGPLPEWAGGADDELEQQEHDAVGAVGLALRRMQNAARAAERAADLDALRGCEGDAAARYFEVFPSLLPLAWRSDFAGRSRRPPRDRVNALLSFGYALLLRDAVAAIARVGLDPMLGLFHTMIPGRPALALDVMEPFRAAWVDTAMLRLIGTGGVDREQFHLSAAGVELSDAGRRAALRAYERRADEHTSHPRFGYRMSYRRLLELEARILAKVLVGELESYTPLWTR